MVRTSGFHPEDRGFESRRGHTSASPVQVALEVDDVCGMRIYSPFAEGKDTDERSEEYIPPGSLAAKGGFFVSI